MIILFLRFLRFLDFSRVSQYLVLCKNNNDSKHSYNAYHVPVALWDALHILTRQSFQVGSTRIPAVQDKVLNHRKVEQLAQKSHSKCSRAGMWTQVVWHGGHVVPVIHVDTDSWSPYTMGFTMDSFMPFTSFKVVTLFTWSQISQISNWYSYIFYFQSQRHSLNNNVKELILLWLEPLYPASLFMFVFTSP